MYAVFKYKDTGERETEICFFSVFESPAILFSIFIPHTLVRVRVLSQVEQVQAMGMRKNVNIGLFFK